MSEKILWRVGYWADPLAFTPPELCSWHHRFDDPARRFRTVYCAERPETALREVLADFRPKASALQAFAEKFGDDALGDVPAGVVAVAWREQHLLTPTRMDLDGDLVDMTDAAVRAELESRHAALLAARPPSFSRPASTAGAMWCSSRAGANSRRRVTRSP